jgi:glutathione peroxidase
MTSRIGAWWCLVFPAISSAQEPGDAADISSFCKLSYNVTFPMFAKIDVNSPGACPLFSWLKAEARGLFGTKKIRWNFTKFLVGRDGRVRHRYGPATKPSALRGAVVALL